MKKPLSILMSLAMLLGALSGCGAAEPQESPPGARPEPTPHQAPGERASVVYMTTDISSEGLLAVYDALDAHPQGNIAVKLSTGEPGSNYLRTDLIGALVQSFDDPTIVECNTA